MSSTLLDTIQVKNVSTQLVPIFVQPLVNSPITTKSGEIKLTPTTSFEAEEIRFDLSQITSLQKKKLIAFTRLRRLVDVAASEGTSGTA